MLSTSPVFIHGDFTPKNVLVRGGTPWVLDFEGAALGDPAYDVASLVNHLLLKAIHRPAHSAAYESCAAAFYGTYERVVPAELGLDPPYVFGQVGCLMLARVYGISPVEYLNQEGRHRASQAGERLLRTPPSTVSAAFGIVNGSKG